MIESDYNKKMKTVKIKYRLSWAFIFIYNMMNLAVFSFQLYYNDRGDVSNYGPEVMHKYILLNDL